MTAIYLDHPNERPYSQVTTLIRDHADDRPSDETTLARDQPEETLLLKAHLMKHADKRPLW